MNLNFEKQHRESLSQRARSSPGVLRSGPMRHDALRGLTRQYRLMNGFMNPGWTAPSQAHLSPFELQRKPKKGDRSTSENFFTFEVASRFVAADSSSLGAREAREMGERKSTRVKTVAKALKRVDDDTRRQVRSSPPSVFPGRCRPHVPHANFSPRNPHRIAGCRCSFGCARER